MSTGRAAASYRDVFAVGEFRALFAAHLLSLVGDQLSRVAVSVLVYADTGSALFAAVAFAISYLPWVVIGPVLTAVADRFPRRTVMIACDAVRVPLVAVLVMPGLPVVVVVAVLFTSALFAPPAQAARAAVLPEVLDGDRYVVANSVTNLSTQLAQVLGFAVGGALVGVLSPRGALLADAVSFAVSALLLYRYMARRPAPAGVTGGTVARDTVDGVRLVMADPALRRFVLLAWTGAACTAAPEGLMTAYAVHLDGDDATVGFLLAAIPFGTVCGAVIYGRFTSPARRWRLVPVMALLSCAALAPVFLDPPLPIVLLLLTVAGYGSAYQLALNARFVQHVPASHRARAFGVAVAGMMLSMGLTTAAAGALADMWTDPALTVGLCGVTGIVAILPLVRNWHAVSTTT
jgi:MFS family permease